MPIFRPGLSMKKLISTVLIIATLISTGTFSMANLQTAEAAAPGAKIIWRQYDYGLRKHLLGYRTSTSSKCDRDSTPRGACLSVKMVNSIMSWVRDPNNDGNFGDAIWVYDTYGRRQKMKEKAKNGFHPYVIKAIVLPWEISTHYQITSRPDVSAPDSLELNRIFWTTFATELSDVNPEFRAVSDYLTTGDFVIRKLAFEQTGEIPPSKPGEKPYPILGLKIKSKISSASLDKIYQTNRMYAFNYHRNDKDWSTEEIATMN